MWLVEEKTLNAMTAAIRAGFTPNAESMERFVAAESRIMAVAGNTAEIKISGVMTNQRDIIAMLFGGGNVTYPDIIDAIASANADPNVTDIVLAFGSAPGGSVDGMIDAMAAVQMSKKPIRATVSNSATSAAYGLASQAQSITAKNKMSRVGSIGIAYGARVDDTVVEIASTNAPNKRPDLSTEEGRAVVTAELDAMHEIFADAIATGRKTTIEKVNADFGRGGTLLAEEALKRGMIDAIAQPIAVVPTPSASQGGNKTEDQIMDLNKLRAEHPDVYQAAVSAGVTQERERVSAHLILGEQAGAMDIATAAIKDGSEFTATINAKYMAAGFSKRELDARKDDNLGDVSTPADKAEAKELAQVELARKTAAAMGVPYNV